jgi:hypothetical protein
VARLGVELAAFPPQQLALDEGLGEIVFGAYSSMRPRCMKITSSESRRAWPRSWVVSTMRVPSAWMA